MGRNLIIGDIHSRYEKLTAVLEKASYAPDSDILYSVGDFCDRGKDAVKTLRFLMDVKNLRAVIGNHDIILQNWLYTGVRDDNWMHYLGGNRTVQDILYRNHLDQAERLMIADWLRSLPLVRVEDKYIIVHGGIPYRRTMDDLLRYQAWERPECSLMTNASGSRRRDLHGSRTIRHQQDHIRGPYTHTGWKTIHIGKVSSGRARYGSRQKRPAHAHGYGYAAILAGLILITCQTTRKRIS